MSFMGPQRRHTACDSCRNKKLRCTGDVPICLRCERMSINCVYSLQKPMGRPKKRCRTPDSELSLPMQSSTDQASNIPALENVSSALDITLASSDQNAWDMAIFGSPLTIPDSLDMQGLYALDEPSTSTHLWANSMQGEGFQAPLDGIEPSGVGSLITQPGMESGHVPLQQHETLAAPRLCACMSAMYLVLDDLSNMQDFSFPFSLHNLRKAVNTGWGVVRCEHCPALFLTAMQNVQLLGLLLVTLAERYNKVQKAIAAERQRCELAGETKTFRIGDVGSTNAHLHTRDLDCPASFTIELEPSEWYAMANKLLKTEIHGKDEHEGPALVALIRGLEARQRAWHFAHPATDVGELCSEQRASDRPQCLMLAVEAKRLLASMDLD